MVRRVWSLNTTTRQAVGMCGSIRAWIRCEGPGPVMLPFVTRRRAPGMSLYSNRIWVRRAASGAIRPLRSYLDLSRTNARRAGPGVFDIWSASAPFRQEPNLNRGADSGRSFWSCEYVMCGRRRKHRWRRNRRCSMQRFVAFAITRVDRFGGSWNVGPSRLQGPRRPATREPPVTALHT